MSGGTKVKIDLSGKTHEVTCEPGESILEAALNAGIDAPYSCMSGSCTACQAKLITGKVEMDFCDVLTEQEIKAGEILTCQAHPKTPDVHIKYK